MKLSEYTSVVKIFNFETWVEIPIEFENMVKIVAAHFHYNKIEVDKCCRFSELIINILTKGEYDLDLEYEPFNKLTQDLNEPMEYKFIPCNNYNRINIIVDGEKSYLINSNENLSFKDLLERIK